ncbi:hypothetical protein X975_21924, partial [Stegodyphus mimosarum]
MEVKSWKMSEYTSSSYRLIQKLKKDLKIFRNIYSISCYQTFLECFIFDIYFQDMQQ